MEFRNLEKLLEIKREEYMKLAVVACHDEEVLDAVVESYKLGISEPILIGDREKTISISKEKNLDIGSFEIIDEKDLDKAAEIGVKMVRNGEANFIMKGLVDTSILLKAVLNKEWGLRTDSLLSHVMVYEVPNYHKLIYLTDGGMNLEPSIEDKVKIIKNAAEVARAMGNKSIKVACLAAKEKVNSKMKATVDAGELKSKYENGEFEKDIIIEGPMALDLAISSEAAKIKGYKSEVAGDADILLVPNIEMGNGIGKSITYFAGGKSAGIVMGAKAPIVLVSRADDHMAKLYSIALGSISAKKQN
ncbi:MAG: bifunctional enoyl-CoA hydratase/phosphate acetyltransferase [Tissierellaceae bacterium]|nr:bifunctional enoyl-CoA hydratase/phosphate acetyltransferase [Tissierellaceae bacterium]